jgi:hypothetical protein
MCNNFWSSLFVLSSDFPLFSLLFGQFVTELLIILIVVLCLSLPLDFFVFLLVIGIDTLKNKAIVGKFLILSPVFYYHKGVSFDTGDFDFLSSSSFGEFVVIVNDDLSLIFF